MRSPLRSSPGSGSPASTADLIARVEHVVDRASGRRPNKPTVGADRPSEDDRNGTKGVRGAHSGLAPPLCRQGGHKPPAARRAEADSAIGGRWGVNKWDSSSIGGESGRVTRPSCQRRRPSRAAPAGPPSSMPAPATMFTPRDCAPEQVVCEDTPVACRVPCFRGWRLPA